MALARYESLRTIEPPPSGRYDIAIDPAVGDEKKLLDNIRRDFEKSQTFLSPYWDQWRNYYQLFRTHNPKAKSRPWRANIMPPVVFANVMHGLAQMLDLYFGQRTLFPLSPRGDGWAWDASKLMETYLQWEVDDIPGFPVFYQILQDTLLYGTGWAKVVWDWEYERNCLDYCPVWNVFPDGTAADERECDYVIFRYLRSPAYIKRMAKLGVYEIEPDEIDKLANGSYARQGEPEDKLTLIGKASELYTNRIEVLERWDYDGVTVGLNRERLVRAKPNRSPHGEIPILRFVDQAVSGELLGVGEVEPIEKVVYELASIRNQRLDVASMAINNMFVAAKNAGIDESTLLMRPGGIIWADSPDAVKPLITNTQGMAIGVQEEQVARFDIQEGTGNWGYNQGQTPQRRETATTVLALQRASGQRFSLKGQWNRHLPMRRAAKMMIANAQELMPNERWLRLRGDRLLYVSRETLQGSFDFIIEAGTEEPREVVRNRIKEILPLVMASPRINDQRFFDYLLDIWQVPGREYMLLSDEEMLTKMLIMGQQKEVAPQYGAPGLNGEGTMIGSPNPMMPPQSIDEIAMAENL